MKNSVDTHKDKDRNDTREKEADDGEKNRADLEGILKMQHRIEACKVAMKKALAQKTIGELQASTGAGLSAPSKESRKVGDMSKKATATASGARSGDKKTFETQTAEKGDGGQTEGFGQATPRVSCRDRIGVYAQESETPRSRHASQLCRVRECVQRWRWQ